MPFTPDPFPLPFSQGSGTGRCFLLVDDKVDVGDEDGDVVIFRHSADTALALPNGVPVAEVTLPSSIDSTPIVAKNVLDIATKDTLDALETGAVSEAPQRRPTGRAGRDRSGLRLSSSATSPQPRGGAMPENIFMQYLDRFANSHFS